MKYKERAKGVSVTDGSPKWLKMMHSSASLIDYVLIAEWRVYY